MRRQFVSVSLVVVLIVVDQLVHHAERHRVARVFELGVGVSENHRQQRFIRREDVPYVGRAHCARDRRRVGGYCGGQLLGRRP